MTRSTHFKHLRDTLAYAAGVLTLTYLAFVVVILLQTIARPAGLADVQRMLVIAAIFTAVVFVCGILIQLPLLALAGPRLGIFGSTVVGALLGIVPMSITLVVLYQTRRQPSVRSYMMFWSGAPATLIVDLLSYVVAGAVIGWSAAQTTRRK